MKFLLISNINLIFKPNSQGTARECENQTGVNCFLFIKLNYNI